MITDEMVKRAATEFLSHKGENPYRVTRRGAELWEDYAPAMHAALAALPLPEPVAWAAKLDRFERAAMAYERLGKITRDDEKSRQMRKDAIAELAEARRALTTPPAPLPSPVAVGIDPFNEIIDRIKHRCMAADGPVTPTMIEITDAELAEVWRILQTLRFAFIAAPTPAPLPSEEDDLRAARVSSEALRDDLLSVFRGIAVYWANLPDVDKATGHPLTTEGRCDGVVFSILSQLDGVGQLPAFDLVSHVHPDDDDQSLEGVVISDMLHEHYGSALRSRPASALPVVGEDGKLAPGCCSAISPCSHQRQDPRSICATCRAALPKEPA